MSQLSFFEATSQLPDPPDRSIAPSLQAQSIHVNPDSQPSPSTIVASSTPIAHRPQYLIAPKRKGQAVESLAIDLSQKETPSTFAITAPPVLYDCCRLCRTPIAIPGLDANCCPSCGWVADRAWLSGGTY